MGFDFERGVRLLQEYYDECMRRYNIPYAHVLDFESQAVLDRIGKGQISRDKSEIEFRFGEIENDQELVSVLGLLHNESQQNVERELERFNESWEPCVAGIGRIIQGDLNSASVIPTLQGIQDLWGHLHLPDLNFKRPESYQLGDATVWERGEFPQFEDIPGMALYRTFDPCRAVVHYIASAVHLALGLKLEDLETLEKRESFRSSPAAGPRAAELSTDAKTLLQKAPAKISVNNLVYFSTTATSYGALYATGNVNGPINRSLLETYQGR